MTDLRLTQASTEALVSGNPAARASQAALEVLVGPAVPLQLSQAALEVLVATPVAETPPAGNPLIKPLFGPVVGSLFSAD